MAVLAQKAPIAAIAPAGGYVLPPAPLQALVDAPRPPQLSISPHRDLLALTQTPSLPGIDVVAQPELKLAGLRINPRTYAQSWFSFGSDLWLMDVATGKEIRLQGLPTPLSIAVPAGRRISATSPLIRSMRSKAATSCGLSMWLHIPRTASPRCHSIRSPDVAIAGCRTVSSCWSSCGRKGRAMPRHERHSDRPEYAANTGRWRRESDSHLSGHAA
jgi:hypothetical protein